ncbi:MAG: TIGR04282 family arsenosugar biosynthesis glycosyltransferase, partial [Planctomycetes bacterium]|nr:TIGR04282 family arsenosugar biosynthesis glycosyltransferase [Planctomycetota bacterium]
MDNALLIFLKYPEAGKVKTRLAKKIGDKKAAKLYRLFVEATIKRTLDNNGRYEQLLFYTPVERKSEIESWIGRSVVTPPLQPQIGAELGERMLNALKTSFSSGAKKAVIIGTDSPRVDKEIIYEAFYLLKENDVVIGPTIDGGYYLIGTSLP